MVQANFTPFQLGQPMMSISVNSDGVKTKRKKSSKPTPATIRREAAEVFLTKWLSSLSDEDISWLEELTLTFFFRQRFSMLALTERGGEIRHRLGHDVSRACLSAETSFL